MKFWEIDLLKNELLAIMFYAYKKDSKNGVCMQNKNLESKLDFSKSCTKNLGFRNYILSSKNMQDEVFEKQ